MMATAKFDVEGGRLSIDVKSGPGYIARLGVFAGLIRGLFQNKEVLLIHDEICTDNTWEYLGYRNSMHWGIYEGVSIGEGLELNDTET